MLFSAFSATALALATAQLCSAQTFTSCDPTKKSCPPDKALGKTITVDFTQGASDQFSLADGTTLTYGPNGAEFTMNKETDAPTISSNWYIFFGKVDLVMQAAPGTGIVSSFVMESDDLDEIDLEWLGGDTTQVETNYFGKGNTTTYDRATYETVASPQTTFHTYTIDWTSAYIKWFVDGNLVRTLNYGDANGGKNFPQTPMQVKMGNWDGGSSTSPEGTVQWAGGHSDFSQGPFTMYVKSVTIQDYSTGGAEYVYTDMSGSWQSIQTSDSSSDSDSSAAPSSTASKASTATSAGSTVPSTASSNSSTASTSAVPSAPVATGGLGGGAITGPPGTVATTLANQTSASSTSASSSTSPSAAKSSSGATAIGAGRFGVADAVMAVLGLGLGYMAM